MIFSPAMSTHNHSNSESLGDRPASVQDRLSWVNVAEPCFLLEIDQARAKCGITSLSTQVHMVSYRKMTRALVLWARHSTTPILLAVVPSMFSWKTAGFRYFAKCSEKCFPASQQTLLNSSPNGWISLFFFSSPFFLIFILCQLCFPLSIKMILKVLMSHNRLQTEVQGLCLLSMKEGDWL